MNPWLSTMPVLGESKAPWQANAGSKAWACARLSHCKSSTPLTSAFAWVACKMSIWSGAQATNNLPQRWCAIPRSAKYA